MLLPGASAVPSAATPPPETRREDAGNPDRMAPKAKEKEVDADPGKTAREYVNPTPEGALKSMDEPMAPAYVPHGLRPA